MGNHLCRDLAHRDLAGEAGRKSITTIIEAKEPLVKTLNKYAKLVRSEHCFLLFEELGKTDKCFSALRCSDGCRNNGWYIADNGIYSKLITVMGKKGGWPCGSSLRCVIVVGGLSTGTSSLPFR